MTTVRLDKEIQDKLDLIAKLEHKSKSEIIKAALSEYFSRYSISAKPFLVGEDLFGQYGSEETDLSENYKQKLKGRLREKHSR